MQTCIPLKEKSVTTVFLLGLIVLLFFAGCTVVKTNYSDSAKKLATVYYYLPETLIKITASAKVAVVYDPVSKALTDESHILEETYVFTPETIADTKHLLSLNYKPSVLMADKIKYGVDDKGLLESIDIATEDRTPDIISKLTEAPVTIFGVKGVVPEKMNLPNINKPIVKIKDFTTEFAIKASEILTRNKSMTWNLILINEEGVDENVKSIDAGFTLSTDEKPYFKDGDKLVNRNSDPKAVPSLECLLKEEDTERKETRGILTRPQRNIGIKIKSHNEILKFNSEYPTYVSIADPTKLIVIPVERTAFVSRKNNIVFKEGLIKSNSIDKPSSVEGFLSIPIDIAKAIVSIPAEIIQFKINNTTNSTSLETAKLNYEKSLQQNQMYTLQKGLQMDSLQLEIQKADIRSQQALEKLKAELQTSLSTAQIAQLQTQHQLDSLKQVIDSLKTHN